MLSWLEYNTGKYEVGLSFTLMIWEAYLYLNKYVQPWRNAAFRLRLVACHGRLKLTVHLAFGERHMALDPPHRSWIIEIREGTLL